MKVVVTGAGGFIGSHLVEYLLGQGVKVKAFIHYNSEGHRGFLEGVEHENLEFELGDVRDFDSVISAMKDCSAVFHLAALIGIPYSYRSPKAYLQTNTEGTYNILEASKMIELDEVLVTSTSETYGSAQYIPIDEDHPKVGQSPYAASKIGADQFAISYHRSFDLPVKIVRPFNTYGPRQSARAVIPTIITQLLSGGDKIELGNLHPTRDFTYVKDTVRGFWEIFRADELYGEATNIGMNEEVSIGDLADLIVEIIGKDIEIISDSKRERPENSEVDRLYCDNSKIKKYTGWEPQYNLERGLQETIQWINNNQDRFDSSRYYV